MKWAFITHKIASHKRITSILKYTKYNLPCNVKYKYKMRKKSKTATLLCLSIHMMPSRARFETKRVRNDDSNSKNKINK